MKFRSRRKIIFAIALMVMAVAAGGYFIIRAASSSVSDTFDNPQYIASRSNTTICGGQIKLAESSWTTLTECNCNSVSGWYWFTTNGRSACWSKELADSVSWNKGVGNDTDNPGSYTCATDVTALKDRMAAASAGEWYKIVSEVNSVTITSAHNGSAGYGYISALAIADCLDGSRDLCTGDGCLGADVAAVNSALRTWASATGNKSALPYCAGSGCDTAANSDYRAACEASTNADLPLPGTSTFSCYLTDVFFKNQKTCNDGDTNFTWAAAAYTSTLARVLGYHSCSYVSSNYTSGTNSIYGFRVVLRP